MKECVPALAKELKREREKRERGFFIREVGKESLGEFLTLTRVIIGKDFDFSGNTARFSTGISEEEAFFVKRKQQHEDQGILFLAFVSLFFLHRPLFFLLGNQQGFRNPWAATPVRPTAVSGSASSIRNSFGEVKFI
jgi:hypothetical protein